MFIPTKSNIRKVATYLHITVLPPHYSSPTSALSPTPGMHSGHLVNPNGYRRVTVIMKNFSFLPSFLLSFPPLVKQNLWRILDFAKLGGGVVVASMQSINAISDCIY